MRKLKSKNLYTFLSDFKLTERASDYFSDLLDFSVKQGLGQDRLVELGRILSRVISLEFTLRLSDTGFNQRLIDNTIQMLRVDVERMVTTFVNKKSPDVVEEYEEASSWLDAIAPKYAHS